MGNMVKDSILVERMGLFVLSILITLKFTDEITICAWVRPTLEAGPGTWQLIAAKGPDVDEFFEILLHPDGFIWMGWRLTGGRVCACTESQKCR